MTRLGSMKLCATGFNAWDQLVFNEQQRSERGEPDDIYAFRNVLEGAHVAVPTSKLSYTLVWRDSELCKAGAGFPDDEKGLSLACQPAENALGEVLVLDERDGIGCSLVKYPSLDAAKDKTDGQSWPCPKVVRHIAAFDVGWVILYGDGTVATLGDARFEDCLGREATEQSPADAPGDVPDLNNLGEPVRKVAAGGYMVAALTASGALYVWGMGIPGATRSRQPGVSELSGLPNCMEVDGDKDAEDIGVGESHAIALTTDGAVYVIGGNENGQLGLGKGFQGRAHSWTRVWLHLADGYRVVRVAAGPRSSFVLVTGEPSES